MCNNDSADTMYILYGDHFSTVIDRVVVESTRVHFMNSIMTSSQQEQPVAYDIAGLKYTFGKSCFVVSKMINVNDRKIITGLTLSEDVPVMWTRLDGTGDNYYVLASVPLFALVPGSTISLTTGYQKMNALVRKCQLTDHGAIVSCSVNQQKKMIVFDHDQVHVTDT